MSVLRVLPVRVHLIPDENVARFLGSRMVRAGTAWTAELKRAPLSIGERLIPEELALKIVRIWLETGFDGGRHLRRVAMLNAM